MFCRLPWCSLKTKLTWSKAKTLSRFNSDASPELDLIIPIK